jgi:hypothetical protein
MVSMLVSKEADYRRRPACLKDRGEGPAVQVVESSGDSHAEHDQAGRQRQRKEDDR